MYPKGSKTQLFIRLHIHVSTVGMQLEATACIFIFSPQINTHDKYMFLLMTLLFIHYLLCSTIPFGSMTQKNCYPIIKKNIFQNVSTISIAGACRQAKNQFLLENKSLPGRD